MRRIFLALSLSAAAACGAELSSVRSVYVMSMAHGLDQYLANRLTNEHIFQVVADPKKADAVITDHLGPGFQAELEEISPTPAAPKPAAEAPKEPAKSGKEAQSSPFIAETVNKLENPAMHSSFGRAKGTIFIVALKSRDVLWSIYEPPKDTGSKEMDRTASEIVAHLKKELNPKK